MNKQADIITGGAFPSDGDDDAIRRQDELFVELARRSSQPDPEAEQHPLVPGSPLGARRSGKLSLDPISQGAMQLFESWAPQHQGGKRATCVAFAVLAMVELYDRLHTKSDGIANYSEEFLYYMMREKHVPSVMPENYENGSTFMDQAARALETNGVCSEATMPYNGAPTEPAHVEKPSIGVIEEALNNRFDPDSFHYLRLFKKEPEKWKAQGLVKVIRNELKNGNPVTAAFPLYSGDDQWFDPDSVGRRFGWVADPTAHDHVVTTIQEHGFDLIKGGHAVCIIGYQQGDSKTDGRFLLRNSWGERFRHAVQKVPGAPDAATCRIRHRISNPC